MAAAVTKTSIDGAAGNTLVLAGSGLTPGAGAGVTIDQQGVDATPNLALHAITLPATFAGDGSNVTIVLPDGIQSGTMTITAADATFDTCRLSAKSQYLQASEYVGEGMDAYVATLAAGELDTLIRRASALCDAYMSNGIRYLQTLEKHRYKARENGAPFVFPFRSRGRRLPIVSIDQITFVSAKDIVTTFDKNDVYLNELDNYVEILAYAIGNYALLAQLQTVGYSANVIELAMTSGYTADNYPEEIKFATTLATTMLLARHQRNSMGMVAFKSFEKEVVVDEAGIKLPTEARVALAPWCALALA